MGIQNANTAYYLKYRPQSLDNLIGQENVKKVLLSAFKNQKFSHAYLFVGPRGTGKTSTARILAKMVNCSAQQNQVPCNQCSVCLSITDGSNLDLIEIDAASNRGIEDIRALKETIKLSPSGKGKKIYIIDEVHMLTTEAFNALLKTLEEPPEHALFILATTDSTKLPATILSRVQRLDFKLATLNELQGALERIVKKEQIDIDKEAVEILTKKADGSFRDGIKLLDQFGSGGEKITAKDLLMDLRLSKFDDLLGLLKDFKMRNISGSLMRISGYLKNGAEVKELILSLMELMRDLMLIKNGLGLELVEPKITKDKYSLLVELGEGFDFKDLTKKLNILQDALPKLKFASILSLPLELAVVEMCGEQILNRSEYKEIKGVKESRDQIIGITERPDSQNSDIPVNKYLDLPISRVSEGETPLISSRFSGSPISSDSPIFSDDILKLKEKWNFVLETIRPTNFSLEALLRSVNVAECNEKSVILEVPYAFHQRILEAPKNRDLLESILSDILGRPLKVVTVLGVRPAHREDIANIEVAADDEIIRVAAEIFNSDPVN